jgi:hypothetical protein
MRNACATCRTPSTLETVMRRDGLLVMMGSHDACATLVQSPLQHGRADARVEAPTFLVYQYTMFSIQRLSVLVVAFEGIRR